MKLLQGALFFQMRSKILNIPSSASTYVHRSVLSKANNKANKSKEGSMGKNPLAWQLNGNGPIAARINETVVGIGG